MGHGKTRSGDLSIYIIDHSLEEETLNEISDKLNK